MEQEAKEDEEQECEFCRRQGKFTDAVCLYKGMPSCFTCIMKQKKEAFGRRLEAVNKAPAAKADPRVRIAFEAKLNLEAKKKLLSENEKVTKEKVKNVGSFVEGGVQREGTVPVKRVTIPKLQLGDTESGQGVTKAVEPNEFQRGGSMNQYLKANQDGVSEDKGITQIEKKSKPKPKPRSTSGYVNPGDIDTPPQLMNIKNKGPKEQLELELDLDAKPHIQIITPQITVPVDDPIHDDTPPMIQRASTYREQNYYPDMPLSARHEGSSHPIEFKDVKQKNYGSQLPGYTGGTGIIHRRNPRQPATNPARNPLALLEQLKQKSLRLTQGQRIGGIPKSANPSSTNLHESDRTGINSGINSGNHPFERKKRSMSREEREEALARIMNRSSTPTNLTRNLSLRSTGSTGAGGGMQGMQGTQGMQRTMTPMRTPGSYATLSSGMRVSIRGGHIRKHSNGPRSSSSVNTSREEGKKGVKKESKFRVFDEPVEHYIRGGGGTGTGAGTGTSKVTPPEPIFPVEKNPPKLRATLSASSLNIYQSSTPLNNPNPEKLFSNKQFHRQPGYMQKEKVVHSGHNLSTGGIQGLQGIQGMQGLQGLKHTKHIKDTKPHRSLTSQENKGLTISTATPSTHNINTRKATTPNRPPGSTGIPQSLVSKLQSYRKHSSKSPMRTKSDRRMHNPVKQNPKAAVKQYQMNKFKRADIHHFLHEALVNSKSFKYESRLIYSATANTLKPHLLHDKCDEKGSFLFILEANLLGKPLYTGGFSDIGWMKDFTYLHDTNSGCFFIYGEMIHITEFESDLVNNSNTELSFGHSGLSFKFNMKTFQLEESKTLQRLIERISVSMEKYKVIPTQFSELEFASIKVYANIF